MPQRSDPEVDPINSRKNGSRIQSEKKQKGRLLGSAISRNQYLVRQAKWSESVAVGRPSFLERIKKDSGHKSRGRRIEKEGNSFVLREEKLGCLTNLIPPPKKAS